MQNFDVPQIERQVARELAEGVQVAVADLQIEGAGAVDLLAS